MRLKRIKIQMLLLTSLQATQALRRNVDDRTFYMTLYLISLFINFLINFLIDFLIDFFSAYIKLCK